MAEPPPLDDPDNVNKFEGFPDFDFSNDCFKLVEDRDSNLQEESTQINLELRDDQVKDSASCSAINKKTDASSSRTRDSSETGEIRREHKEDDRNDEYKPKESDDESDLYDGYHEMKRFCEDLIATSGHTMNPQQQLTSPIRGSTSSTSDRNKISLLSPYAPKWKPQNTCQNPSSSDSERVSQVMMPPGENSGLGSLVTESSHQNQIARSGPTTNPQQQFRRPNHGSTSDKNSISQLIGMQSQLSPFAAAWEPQNTGQQHPMTDQFRGPAFLDHNYEPWRLQNTYQQHMRPMQDQMMNPYQHPVANQQNFYQLPMADPRMPPFWNAPRGQPRSFAIGQNYFNPQQAWPELNQHQMLQHVPQRQQPTHFQGFNTRPSSEHGQDQQQPR